MRKESTSNIVFGTRAILETIESGKEIDKVLIQKGLSNELTKQLVKTMKGYQVPFSTVPIEKLNRVTRKNHQGAIAFISSIQYASLDNVINDTYQKGKEPLLLILDRVTDVRNFGALARSAECAGVDAIIIPSRGGAAINADAMKTSAGALNYIPVCREENLKNTLRYLKDNGIAVLACTEKTEKSLYEVDFKRPVAILMGSEEDGISPEYLKQVDDRMKIPMLGQIESLNVSVSASIAIFEVNRQRNL